MPDFNLLGMSGSLRKDSHNTALLREAARLSGAHLTLADLRLPLYDGDLEDAEGIPPEVQRLADQIRDADAVLIATPEYNQCFSGVLKNALDWVSRTRPNPWRDKPVAIVSAAGGRAGGARAQYALRLAMTPFQPHLLCGPEVMVAAAGDQFDADGTLSGGNYAKLLARLLEALHKAARTRQLNGDADAP